MLVERKFMEMLMIYATIGETHLQQGSIELLMLLLEERINAAESLRVPALVMFTKGILDLLAIMQPQLRKDFL